ncbi:hypothetical protein GR702_05190 [Novosphingobium sp. FGD1]|jgi:hypothetical protein|uniref:Uncharacterized protein n=1 Tax=Novosphingobium silvae TaxID=2692619 RepID=A0A7X4K6H0_9SPHN|nr:hypothetical protein [Novosphingobium silvae]MYL97165.1 hypothetical protein [Novosphingobium silvae]
MAHRLLLTLLALLTGLAAQIGPAEARASHVADMQLVAPHELATTKAPRAPAGLARLPGPGSRTSRLHAPLPVARVPVAVATVFTGIDRARE